MRTSLKPPRNSFSGGGDVEWCSGEDGVPSAVTHHQPTGGKLLVWRVKWARYPDRVSTIGVPAPRASNPARTLLCFHHKKQHDHPALLGPFLKYNIRHYKRTLCIKRQRTFGGNQNFVTQSEKVRMWVNEMRHSSPQHVKTLRTISTLRNDFRNIFLNLKNNRKYEEKKCGKYSRTDYRRLKKHVQIV